MARAGFAITIGVVDKISTPLDAMSARMNALTKRMDRARAPFEKFSQAFEKLGKASGMTQVATGFSNIARSGVDTFRSLSRIIEPLGAITGAASVAGLYRLSAAWGELGTKLAQQSVRAGVTAESLQTLQGAARLAGVSGETLTSGLTGLNDRMRDAAFGGAPEFIAALQGMQLSFADLQRMRPEERFKLLADAIAKMPNITDRVHFAEALGLGPELLPLLTKGKKGIADLSAEAVKLGAVMSDKNVAAADLFRVAQDRLTLAATGLGNAIATELGPVLGPVLNQMADWIAANRQWIAQDIGGVAKQFADYLRGVDWASVGESINHLAGQANAVAQALGGWQKVGEDLVIFFAGRFVLSMMAPIVTISTALAALPAEAAAAAAKAGTALLALQAKGGGLGLLGQLGKWGGAAAGLGLGALGWEGINLLQEKTQPEGNGIANLLHNMLFDADPLHWTRSYHPGDQASGSQTPALPTGEQDKLAKQAYDYYRNHGETASSAAGMVAGLVREGINPQGVGDGGKAYGIGQWHPDRQAHFKQIFGHDIRDGTFEEQLRFKQLEIMGQGGDDGSAVAGRVMHRAFVTPGVAGDADSRYAERPGDVEGEAAARARLAEEIDTKYGRNWKPSGETVSPATAPASGAPGANGKVDVNVKVAGASKVTATSSGDVGLKVEQRDVARDGY